MNINKIEQQNARLKTYLNAHNRTKSNLLDVVKRVEIEEAKEKLMQYLTVSKSWYEDREDYLETLLIWMEKRMEVLIRNMDSNGK